MRARGALLLYASMLQIGLVQFNPTVGDVHGNVARIADAVNAMTDDLDIIVTPELSICGYPPRDLLLSQEFIRSCEGAVFQLASICSNKTFTVGHPRIDPKTGHVRNSVTVVREGQIIACADKQLLPHYDIFDETRYFECGDKVTTFRLGVEKIGIAICEDFWEGNDVHITQQYDSSPLDELIAAKCDYILAPSASPFVRGKHKKRVHYAKEMARKHGVTIALCNQVGANDDLIFDGGSFVASPIGVLDSLPQFESGECAVKERQSVPLAPTFLSLEEELWSALVLGTRDYFSKSGHTKAVLGISGGIDSALVATVVTAALGPTHVRGVLMPSRYSSLSSIEDAEKLASNLGIFVETLPIEHLHSAFEETMAENNMQPSGLAEENVQARIRGLLLMAIANQTGALLMATGNKSEFAVGYSTLYGDMNGAVSVIGDLYKTDVWLISNWINANFEKLDFAKCPIPSSSITKPPSAELKPNQCDQDSLPEYDELDAILKLHLDDELSVSGIIETNQFDCELVDKVIRMVDLAQFKREQAPVILKTTPRSFGRGRRMPVVMKRSWKAAEGTI